MVGCTKLDQKREDFHFLVFLAASGMSAFFGWLAGRCTEHFLHSLILIILFVAHLKKVVYLDFAQILVQ